jgi:hypothetical protein
MAEGEVRSMGRRGTEEARSGESPGGPVKTAGSHSLGLVRGTQREPAIRATLFGPSSPELVWLPYERSNCRGPTT